jgi:hypothetical protein
MKDIITKLTFAMGKRMSSRETNELYESKKDDWKYDVVLTYAVANFSKRDLVSRCVQLAKDLNLGETDKAYTTQSYWKDLIENLKEGTKKEQQKQVEKEVKKITYSSSDYGCGGSRSYGCGGSNNYSYGCGGSRSSFRGC